MTVIYFLRLTILNVNTSEMTRATTKMIGSRLQICIFAIECENCIL